MSVARLDLRKIHPDFAARPVTRSRQISNGNWPGQYQRIERDPVLAKGVRVIRMPSARGLQDTVTLPLFLVHGFLFYDDAEETEPC
jgi:hypothetical protein